MKAKRVSSPLRTAIIYSVFGVLWILTSDTLLGYFIPHTSEYYPLAQTIKGWLFVLVGAALLYMILNADAKKLKKEEGENKQNQARFRNLVERMPAITYISLVDELSTTLYISPQIEDVLGFSPKEFESNPNVWSEQLHPEDRERVLQAVQYSQKHLKAFTQEYRMVSKGGRVVWFRDQSNLVTGEHNLPLFFEGFMLDITEQKQVEEALQESEFRFRALFDDAPVAIWEEDFSEAKRQIDHLKAQGITDFRAYFSEHPEIAMEYAQKMKVLDVNRTALKLFKANSKEELIQSTSSESSQGESEHNHEDLIAIAEGRLSNHWDGADETLTGEPVQISLSWSVVPGYEESYARVLVTTVDISERKQAEEALRVSEENYRNLVETSDNAIAVLDRDGNILYANQASLHLWGESKLVGKTFHDLFPKEFANHHLTSMRRVIDEQTIDVNELEAVVHGRKMWFHVSMSPLKNLDGSVSTLLLNALNLTERKKAEEAQRRSEILFFKIFRASSIGIHLFRLSDGRSYNVNDAFLEIIGYTREELIGRTANELNLFVNHEAQQAWMKALQEGRSVRNQDTKIRRKSGEIRDCLASLDLIDINGEVMVLVIATDITERKVAEDQLKQSEERYRNTLDTMIEGIQIIDFDWRYTYVNKAVAKQGQSTPEKLLGCTMMEAYPGIEHTELFSILKECMTQRTVKRFENEFVFPDGSSGWFELNIQPAPEGIFILSVDITERKKAEEQLRSSEERFRLMAENIEEGFWITDPNSNEEIYLSPAIERIFGRSTTELLAKSFAFIDSVIPEDVPLVLTNMERQKFGTATDMEYRIRRPDGSLRWIWDRAFPIPNPEGNIKLVTGIATDITERKASDAKIQTQVKRLSALNSIDRAISSSISMNVVLDVLLIEVVAQLGVDAASILLLNETTQSLDFAAGKGFHTSITHSSVPLGYELAGKVGSERKAIHVPNLFQVEDGIKRKDLVREEHFLEYYGTPLITKGQLKGVLEIFNRESLNPDPDWLNYLETLGGQAAIAIENAQLLEGLQKSNQELFMAYDATITGWSHAMDLRDKETEGHTRRVTELTVKLAERMGISQQQLVHIRRGALLHDIGKLGVPDHILLKPDKLTDEEWNIMRMHPTYARDMLTPINYLRSALDIPYCHHEKWDGTGYPRGLKGEEIPLAARLFAVIDVWDALRSDRPYRAGWSAEKTRDYIQAESGKHFDPKVVEDFLLLLDEPTNS
ncbi:MAG: PAS domain S-box protein [Anaerolineales bacterium]